MSAKETFADPAHWAVTAFATTSFMLGFVNAHLINPSALGIVIPVTLIFGGLVQLIVAIIEVTRGSTFGAVVFGTYGPFWIAYGLYVIFFASKVTDGGTAAALFLAMFAVVTFYLFIASLKTDAVLAVIFFLIDVALILLAIGAANGSNSITEIGGWVTMIFAVLAWYHAAAGLIASTWGREVLPVGPIGKKAATSN